VLLSQLWERPTSYRFLTDPFRFSVPPPQPPDSPTAPSLQSPSPTSSCGCGGTSHVPVLLRFAQNFPG
jgi:hypothetical protein